MYYLLGFIAPSPSEQIMLNTSSDKNSQRVGLLVWGGWSAGAGPDTLGRLQKWPLGWVCNVKKTQFWEKL